MYTIDCWSPYSARACSSTHSVATATSSRLFISTSFGLSAAHVLPTAGTIFSCGSKLVKKVATKSEKPLKTLNTTTSAIVATITPTTLIADITFITLVLFLENRYRRAIYNDVRSEEVDWRMVFLLLQQLVYTFYIIKAVINKEA